MEDQPSCFNREARDEIVEDPESSRRHYESHQRPGDCILVWGSFTGDLFRAIGGAIAVSKAPVRRQLIKLAGDVGVGIDFAEDDVEPPE
jgi:hypothetical protein